jgi:hypothetical protein
MNTHLPQQTTLGKALLMNAVGTAIFGLILVAAPIHGWLGLSKVLVVVVGALLLGYAGLLVFFARSARWLIPGGRTAVLGDAGWTLGSIGVIAITDVMTAGGEVALGLSAVFTGVFAYLEYAGAKELS